MTNNPTEESVIRLEAIYKEIEDKAKETAIEATGYDPDYDESLGQYKPKKVEYDKIVRWYKTGAGQYAEKLEMYEKALKAICGHDGGLIPAKHDMIALARIALTHKPTTDDTE